MFLSALENKTMDKRALEDLSRDNPGVDLSLLERAAKLTQDAPSPSVGADYRLQRAFGERHPFAAVPEAEGEPRTVMSRTCSR
jgi:hypothetical protein